MTSSSSFKTTMMILLLQTICHPVSIVSCLSFPSSSPSPSPISASQEGGDHRGAAAQPPPLRQRKTKPTVFQFAPNGVCIQPKYFVEVPNDESSKNGENSNGDAVVYNGDDNHQKAQQDDTVISSPQRRTERKFTMRNVPGDGDCMFLAVALAAATSMGLGGNDALLRAISRETREVVAQILETPSPGVLHITGKQAVKAVDLLSSASNAEGLSKEEYLTLLRKEGRDGGLYGGGPELTVLANVLRRPISIYELEEQQLRTSQQRRSGVTNESCIKNDSEKREQDLNDDVFCNIVCKGSFGIGMFEDPCLSIPNSAILSGVQPGAYSWHLHILVLLMPTGEKHACVLLPETPYEYYDNDVVVLR